MLPLMNIADGQAENGEMKCLSQMLSKQSTGPRSGINENQVFCS